MALSTRPRVTASSQSSPRCRSLVQHACMPYMQAVYPERCDVRLFGFSGGGWLLKGSARRAEGRRPAHPAEAAARRGGRGVAQQGQRLLQVRRPRARQGVLHSVHRRAALRGGVRQPRAHVRQAEGVAASRGRLLAGVSMPAPLMRSCLHANAAAVAPLRGVCTPRGLASPSEACEASAANHRIRHPWGMSRSHVWACASGGAGQWTPKNMYLRAGAGMRRRVP